MFVFLSRGCRKAADCQHADKVRKTVPCSIEGSRLLTRGRVPQDGETPLHAAAAQNWHDQVVRFLLQEGADFTTKSKVTGRRVGGEWKEVERKSFGER